jgi:hypothetical protein
MSRLSSWAARVQPQQLGRPHPLQRAAMSNLLMLLISP